MSFDLTQYPPRHQTLTVVLHYRLDMILPYFENVPGHTEFKKAHKFTCPAAERYNMSTYFTFILPSINYEKKPPSKSCDTFSDKKNLLHIKNFVPRDSATSYLQVEKRRKKKSVAGSCYKLYWQQKKRSKIENAFRCVVMLWLKKKHVTSKKTRVKLNY